MKRRTFMSLFGAATVAPALPTAVVRPSADVVKLATAHARKYPFVSLVGLSHRMGVSQPEAGQLLDMLSRKGMIGPVHHAGRRPVFAASKVFVPAEASALKAAQLQRKRQAVQRQLRQDRQRTGTPEFVVDFSAMMAHLRALCANHAMTQTAGAA